MNKKFLFTLNLALMVSLALPAQASSPELTGALIDKNIVITPKNLDTFLFGKNTDLFLIQYF